MFNKLFLAKTFHLSASPMFCANALTASKAEVRSWGNISNKHLPQWPAIVLHCYMIFLSILRVFQ